MATTSRLSREPGRDLTRGQGWALALASVASFMVVLDMLVVSTALNTIRRDLGASIAAPGMDGQRLHPEPSRCC